MSELPSLVELINARVRKLYEFEVSESFKLETGRVKVRVVTKAEQDMALVGAHKYAERISKESPQAAHDGDIINDAKSAFIACVACRDSAEPDRFPAFLSPEWMMANLTTDEIAYLVNLVNEVRIAESPSPTDISTETIDAIAELCASHAGDDIPEAVLAAYPREYLTNVFVMLALRNAELREQVADISKEFDEAMKAMAEVEEDTQ